MLYSTIVYSLFSSCVLFIQHLFTLYSPIYSLFSSCVLFIQHLFMLYSPVYSLFTSYLHFIHQFTLYSPVIYTLFTSIISPCLSVQLQAAEMEEMRQREANMTALAAIGPRKKRKLEVPGQGVNIAIFFVISLLVVKYFNSHYIFDLSSGFFSNLCNLYINIHEYYCLDVFWPIRAACPGSELICQLSDNICIHICTHHQVED